MSIFDYFRKTQDNQSASIAKERLQIIVAHQRTTRNQPDYIGKMQKEIVNVIRKYVDIEQDQVNVQLDTVDNCSVLELNVTLPQ